MEGQRVFHCQRRNCILNPVGYCHTHPDGYVNPAPHANRHPYADTHPYKYAVTNRYSLANSYHNPNADAIPRSKRITPTSISLINCHAFGSTHSFGDLCRHLGVIFQQRQVDT